MLLKLFVYFGLPAFFEEDFPLSLAIAKPPFLHRLVVVSAGAEVKALPSAPMFICLLSVLWIEQACLLYTQSDIEYKRYTKDTGCPAYIIPAFRHAGASVLCGFTFVKSELISACLLSTDCSLCFLAITKPPKFSGG